jgi:hypothetical protein
MARRPDPKELVLLGLYAEYNKDAGDYRMVNASLLELEPKVWRWSLMMLKTDGLVEGINWVPPGASSADRVLAMNTKNLRLTREGVAAARELVADDGRNRKDALMRIIEWFSELGLEVAREYLLRSM